MYQVSRTIFDALNSFYGNPSAGLSHCPTRECLGRECPYARIAMLASMPLHSMKDLTSMGLCRHTHAVRRMARCSSACMDHLLR